MNKLVFRVCDENSPYWTDLERLFQSEWNDFLFAENYKAGCQLPPVLVALKGNEVVGGLSYSWFREPQGSDDVVWFNAVYVSPEFRGRGIASELINRGVDQVSANIQSNLYVYTNVAPLYESLGWSVVYFEIESNHKVMKISL